MPEYYKVFRSDRKFDVLNLSRGGGVLIGTNSSFHSERLDFSQASFSSLPSVDIVGVKIIHHNIVYYLILIYIPHTLNASNLSILLDGLCELQYLHNANTLIVGDFNLPTYECGASDSSCPSVKTLLDFLHFLSLSQYNNVRNNLNRMLDLVICNTHLTISRVTDALVPEDAYHPALTWIISFERVKPPAMLVPGVEERFNFRKANFSGLYNALSQINWEFLFQHNDINSACTAFYDCVYSIIASFVPKSTSTRSSYPVWFSPKIIRLIKRKRTVWKKAKISGNQFFRDEFVRLRRVVKQEIEFSYRQFVSSAEANITSDPKQFWKFVNLKKKSLGIPSNMTFHDELITNGDDIVNSFAKYFSSVFLLSSNNDFPDITLPNSFHNFNVGTIPENLVFDKLKNLKPKFTNGPDSIPAFVIKDCAAVFTKPLTFLFNLVLVSSKFPDRWKVSKIVPLFKGGNRALIENYRPISILNNFAKVFELTLVEGLRHQCKNLIVGNQHGFVQGRSTVTNLLTITQHLSNNLDNRIQTDVIYADFSKAFDRLDHTILIRKLAEFGFSVELCTFFWSYLRGRSSFVESCNFCSTNFEITSGVPQGSVVGPFLFNIFINDIVKDIKSSALLYADDLKLYRRITCHQDCLELQSDLNKIFNWCKSNCLSLNNKKCYILSFSLAKQIIEYDYNVNNVSLLRTSHVKDLGVVFDVKLSFSEHINTLTSDAVKLLGFIIRNSSSINNEAIIKLLYYSLVRSKLEYAAIVWYPHYTKYIHDIENVQRRFLKYLHFKVNRTYPPRGTTQEHLLQTFSIPSIDHRVRIQYLCFFVKTINSEINCSHLLSLFNFNCSKFRIRSNNILYLPTPRTNILMYSPIHNICRMVNIVHPKIDVFCCKLSDIKKLNFG